MEPPTSQSRLDLLTSSSGNFKLKIFDSKFMTGLIDTFETFKNSMTPYSTDEDLKKLPVLGQLIVKRLGEVKEAAESTLKTLEDEKKTTPPSQEGDCQDEDAIMATQAALETLSATLTTVLTPGSLPDVPDVPEPVEPVDPVPPLTTRAEITYRGADGEDRSIASLNDILVQLIRFKEVPQLSKITQDISRQILSVISILVNDLGKLDVVRAFINKVQMTDSCIFRETVKRIVVPDQYLAIPENTVVENIPKFEPTAPTAARAERMVQSLLSIMSSKK